jgi:hypothetical protein
MTDYVDIMPLLERAYKIGLRDKHIQDLLNIPTGTFSRAKNGTEPLPAQTWMDCKNLIQDCEELQRRNSLPVLWTDLRSVRRQLEALRDERCNPPCEPTPGDSDMFRRFSHGEPLDEIAIRHNLDKVTVLAHIEAVLKRGEYLTRSVQPVQQ